MTACFAAAFPVTACPLTSRGRDAGPVVLAPSPEGRPVAEPPARFGAARPAPEGRRIAMIVDSESGPNPGSRFGPDRFTVVLVDGEGFRHDGQAQVETLAGRTDRMPMRRRKMREAD